MIELINKFFLLNLFDVLPTFFSYLICCLGAIIAGIIVGKEREKAQKAAGLRTFAMVALGACVFTLASRLMHTSEGGVVDLARIPAQIVSGVGFLGAGAVFRSGRIITGLTTAAGIWATAAVGLVFGLGHFVFGVSVTFMIYVLLSIQSYLETRNLHTHQLATFHFYVDTTTGKGPIILAEIINDWGQKIEVIHTADPSPTSLIWQMKLCTDHRPHQRFLSELASSEYILKIVEKT
jgi:uncharacterized membrane protein YhiD involved in acid resistance